MPALTKLERLMLKNQYQILAKLYPERADDYNNYVTVLRDGYELEYDQLLGGFELYDGLDETTCQNVLRILDMFWDLEAAYDALDDKTGIKENWVRYQGFDGNHETELMGYANYQITKLQKFSGLHPANSHSQRYPMYMRMLEEYQASGSLTKDEIIRITEASIHPSNR